ncbi:MAG: ribosome biogenesis GTPase YlqF [Ruminiclostridium sp.]|nr:ribosome biogenesis GTPase YlqF [Ruminiclostridium sp.]MBQ8842337.1 ribosome biogenesis GTPase YlqF [Ruminiclostridium sp.]
MAYEGDIQWFPGHMTKTRRMIEENLKLVDAVVEIVDSRIPESSRNPLLTELVGNKPRIIMLNKCDYSDDEVTKKWREFYEKQGYTVLVCDCRSGKGINRFLPLLKQKLSDLLERRRAKGMIGKALRIMVVGIPNVGKSSFINRMANSKKVKVEDRPGVTRGKQWVSIDKEVELLDMPGILWPKFDDKQVAVRLAFTGAIKDDVMDVEALAEELGTYLKEHYPERLKERYKLDNLDGYITELIARKRGMMVSGGEPDTERAAITLLDEYRSGKIGKITLEQPAE